MKKCAVILLAALLLTGCGSQKTLETVNDVQAQPAVVSAQQVLVDLPVDAAAPVMETEEGKLYICGEAVICLQTRPAGDLEKTVKSACGFTPDQLDMLQTTWGHTRRYDFVWTAAEEAGEQACRGCILDDGAYHYILTATAPAAQAGQLQSAWREMFNSFHLVSAQMELSTGS